MELLSEKKKKAREEEVKKIEGAILKFVNISLQFSLSSANERDEVSSFTKSLPHTETEKTVELEQSNQEVVQMLWLSSYYCVTISFVCIIVFSLTVACGQDMQVMRCMTKFLGIARRTFAG